jgi:hypothetical protein
MFNKLVNTLGIMCVKAASVCKLLGFIIFTVLQDSDQGSDADDEEQQERKPTQQYSIAAQNITNTNVANPQQQQGQQNITTITMGSLNKIQIKQMKLAVISFIGYNK